MAHKMDKRRSHFVPPSHIPYAPGQYLSGDINRRKFVVV
jgi:hypothetical protein